MEIQQATALTERQGITADLYRRFIAYLDAKPKTIETYTGALRQLFNYLALNNVQQPRREDIIAYRDWLKASGHKPATVQLYITAARLFFSWTAQEAIYPNVADRVKGARIDREHKKDYLTGEQVSAVLSEIELNNLHGLRDYAIMLLIVACGLRTVEVTRADVRDLRPRGSFTVLYVQGKGREEKSEYAKIPALVEKAIRAYLKARGKLDGAEPLFVSTSNNSNGKRLSPFTISKIAKRNLRAAGYDDSRLTAHSLRHTAITLSILAGKNITEVQQFARHTDLSTTMIYNHALDKEKNSCSEAVIAAIFK